MARHSFAHDGNRRRVRMQSRRRLSIAVIGSGLSGLSTAWLLIQLSELEQFGGSNIRRHRLARVNATFLDAVGVEPLDDMLGLRASGAGQISLGAAIAEPELAWIGDAGSNRVSQNRNVSPRPERAPKGLVSSSPIRCKVENAEGKRGPHQRFSRHPKTDLICARLFRLAGLIHPFSPYVTIRLSPARP